MTSPVDVLRRRAESRGEDPVLEGPAGTVSAAALLDRVEALAEQLRVSEAAVIGLLSDNSVDWVVADMASQCDALCLVPIPTFFSDAQLRHVLDSASIDTLLFDEQNQQRISALLGGGNDACAHGAPTLRWRRLAVAKAASMPAGTEKLTFTSGSTGSPKGVCLSLAQCQRVAVSLASVLDEEAPRHLCALPLSTLLENIGGLYMPLISAGTSLVYPLEQLGMAGSSGLRPRRFLKAVSQLQPSTMILVPQFLSLFDSALSSGWQAPASLRFVAVGGGRVAPAVVQRVRAAGLPVYEGYGLSECASVVALNTRQHDRPGTSGKVLPHVTVVQQNSELVVCGNSFLGYLDEPRSWGVEQILTGDLGSVTEDGFVTVKGRSKNVLVSSFGRNISPEWVESELLASGLFAQVMVLGDDRPFCAALLLPATNELDDASVQLAIDKVNATLPDYARVARWLRLFEPFSVAAGSLTDNGRLRRDHICKRYTDEVDQLYSITEQEPMAV